MTLENLKFPIGHFVYDSNYTSEQIKHWISVIEMFPKKIDEITTNLTSDILSWRYRPEGWCIKQVVHHCADSHMNSFIRFKLALTENLPIIKPYEEHLWTEMIDETDDNLTASIAILQGVHYRWTKVLNHLEENQWSRKFMHPATQKTVELKEALGLYAWHCEHHLAHIQQALDNQGNFGTI